MFTIASIIDSQNLETKLRLHFAVVEDFSVENMIKIYTLRDKIRDDVEFNFYNAKKVEIDLNNTNPNGIAINCLIWQNVLNSIFNSSISIQIQLHKRLMLN
jgi:hypothetical protein